MKILRSFASAARAFRAAPRPLVLVPTMGALHEGHLSLIQRARALAGPSGTVVVSIFVNPTQFGPKEDLSRYPRPLAQDTAKCRKAGVDLLFLPTPEGMYAPDFSTWVDESLLSTGLCGASRPGHFRGVCTVVAKLFNLVMPDIAVFGKKDAQQLAVIRRMVRDLNYQIEIIGITTHREEDDLAMSSRNRFLTPEERKQARVIPEALRAAKQLEGTTTNALVMARKIRDTVTKKIGTAPLARIDYVEVVDAETLAAPSRGSRKLLTAVAVFFGKTRLIDNLEIYVA